MLSRPLALVTLLSPCSYDMVDAHLAMLLSNCHLALPGSDIKCVIEEFPVCVVCHESLTRGFSSIKVPCVQVPILFVKTDSCTVNFPSACYGLGEQEARASRACLLRNSILQILKGCRSDCECTSPVDATLETQTGSMQTADSSYTYIIIAMITHFKVQRIHQHQFNLLFCS